MPEDRDETDKKTMPLRLPIDLYQQIKDLADSEDRSIHNMLLRLLREALEARGK